VSRSVEHKDGQNGEVCEEPPSNITKGRLLCILLMYEAIENNEK